MSRERERLIYDDDDEEDEVGKRIKREIDVTTVALLYNQQQQQKMGRRHMLGPPTGVHTGTGTAVAATAAGSSLNSITPCAACKLLRRRCAEECPFSPYFSPHEPQKFAAVHKVFGASNVSKMLMEVGESQRADAANSLVYEANVRLRDPIYGCMGAISALQQQVQTLQAEVNVVRAEILKYKYREAANNLISAAATHPAISLPTATVGAAAAVVATLPQPQIQLSHPQPQSQSQQQTGPPPPPATPPHSACSSLYTPRPALSPNSATTATGFTSISTDHSVAYFD